MYASPTNRSLPVSERIRPGNAHRIFPPLGGAEGIRKRYAVPWLFTQTGLYSKGSIERINRFLVAMQIQKSQTQSCVNVRVIRSLLKGAIIKRDCFDITALMLKTVPHISESPQMIRKQSKDTLVARTGAAIVFSF